VFCRICGGCFEGYVAGVLQDMWQVFCRTCGGCFAGYVAGVLRICGGGERIPKGQLQAASKLGTNLLFFHP
jgi:hypothetical protein